MSKVQVTRSEAAGLIRKAQRLLFFLHVSPDGDSIGSSLAMVRALRKAGKDAIIVGVDPVPRVFRYLQGWDTYFVPWEQVEGQWDLSVFMDCGDLHRVGAALPVVSRAPVTLNVDHHKSNGLFGDYNYVEYDRAACGELAYLLLQELGLEVDREMAEHLYTTLSTDTGSFRFENVRPDTLRIAADLLERGAHPETVAQQVYDNNSWGHLKLLGMALAGMRTDADGKAAYVTVTRAMMAEAGAEPEDTEGIVDFPRTLSGVEVGAIFREAPEPGKVKVSLRSQRWLDVSAVAGEFGGGGHARAAGISMQGELGECVEKVLASLRRALAAGPADKGGK